MRPLVLISPVALILPGVPVRLRLPLLIVCVPEKVLLPVKVLLFASSGTTAELIESVPLVVIGLGLASKPAPAARWSPCRCRHHRRRSHCSCRQSGYL